jgi:hypothetical protein
MFIVIAYSEWKERVLASNVLAKRLSNFVIFAEFGYVVRR